MPIGLKRLLFARDKDQLIGKCNRKDRQDRKEKEFDKSVLFRILCGLCVLGSLINVRLNLRIPNVY